MRQPCKQVCEDYVKKLQNLCVDCAPTCENYVSTPWTVNIDCFPFFSTLMGESQDIDQEFWRWPVLATFFPCFFFILFFVTRPFNLSKLFLFLSPSHFSFWSCCCCVWRGPSCCCWSCSCYSHRCCCCCWCCYCYLFVLFQQLARRCQKLKRDPLYV